MLTKTFQCQWIAIDIAIDSLLINGTFKFDQKRMKQHKKGVDRHFIAYLSRTFYLWTFSCDMIKVYVVHHTNTLTKVYSVYIQYLISHLNKTENTNNTKQPFTALIKTWIFLISKSLINVKILTYSLSFP
jgi:hypothetical protein